jgi:hypothetical protein
MKNSRVIAHVGLLICVALMSELGVAQPNRATAKSTVTPSTTPEPQSGSTNGPTPEATKIVEERASSWYSDRNVLAGALQGFAALVAVLLGFGLSIFAEKRAWRRRKTEQIREKQLSALLAFLADIHELIENAQKVSTELKNVASSLPPGTTGGRVAALEATRATLKLRVAEWLKELDNDRRVALLRVTELRLLKIGKEALGRILETMATVETLIGLVSKVQPETIVTTVTEFDNRLQALASISDALVESAIKSLHD